MVIHFSPFFCFPTLHRGPVYKTGPDLFAFSLPFFLNHHLDRYVAPISTRTAPSQSLAQYCTSITKNLLIPSFNQLYDLPWVSRCVAAQLRASPDCRPPYVKPRFPRRLGLLLPLCGASGRPHFPTPLRSRSSRAFIATSLRPRSDLANSFLITAITKLHHDLQPPSVRLLLQGLLRVFNGIAVETMRESTQVPRALLKGEWP